MVGLWSLPTRGGEGRGEPYPTTLSSPRFEDYDPFTDFDPIEEWLVDPDHAPMPMDVVLGANQDGSDPKMTESLIPGDDLGAKVSNPDENGSGRAELALKEESSGFPIDEKLGKVSLVEAFGGDVNGNGSVADSFVDGGEERSQHNICAEAGNGIDTLVESSVSCGEEREGPNPSMEVDKANGSLEICTISGSGEKRSEAESDSDQSEDDSDSSSEKSSSSSSEEEEEEDDDSHDDNDSGSKERRKDEVLEVEEGEIRDEGQDNAILGSDEDEDTVKGPVRSKHEIEVSCAVFSSFGSLL